MASWAKRFAGVIVATAVFALMACGAGDRPDGDRRKQLTDELTNNRGFTNIVIEKVNLRYKNDSATALVSFGGCRIRLTWSEKDSWRLADGSKVPGTVGEITANMLAEHPSYKKCASQPAPGQSSSKSS